MASLGYRMPAEWQRHEATWLAFPHHRTDFIGKLPSILPTFAEMARVIVRGELLRFIVRDSAQKQRARKMFDAVGVDLARVQFVCLATNRSWLRDSLPLWVVPRGRQKLGSARPSSLAVKFRFNGWARYRDHLLDDAAGQSVAQRFAPAFVHPEVSSGKRAVLEGGSIDVDGAGTLIATEECLFRSPRARFASAPEAESVLKAHLGVTKILWLGAGIAGDDTSGHVDDFARFAPKGRILLCEEKKKSDANYEPLAAAKRRLAGAMSATGRALEVVSLPMPQAVYYRGERLPASYANFYVCNAAVLVPTFNDPADREALSILADCFTDRPVVGIHARDLVVGLGTLHCSSMQQPWSTESKTLAEPGVGSVLEGENS